MTTTINIHNLNLFFNAALDVDDLLHRITQRIQNIDLPSPGDTIHKDKLDEAQLAYQVAQVMRKRATARATPDPVTPIAPSAPVTTPLEAPIAEVATQEQTPDPVTPIAPTDEFIIYSKEVIDGKRLIIRPSNEIIPAAPTAAPEPVTPIAPTEPPVAPSVTIAQLDANRNLELVQEQRPLRSLPPSTVAQPEKDAIFYMRFPPGDPLDPDRQVHRNGDTPGTRKPEPEPQPVAPTVPAIRKAAIKPPPTANHRLATELATKRAANGAEMEFEEFDALVKKEVKRLSSAGTMPSHALWNSVRDPKLPTLATVITRYGAASAEELARMLGYNPPLRGPGKSAQTEVQAEPA